MKILEHTASAISYSLFDELSNGNYCDSQKIACGRFVSEQIGAMPDYLRFAFCLLSFAISIFSILTSGCRLHRLSPENRARVIALWLKIPFVAPEFILAFKTLTAFYICAIIKDDGSLI
ncbi:MAG: hypothetical protein LBQ52_00850 [Helicobacteraceae bacterium]|jgi:hypothetical protein|nr:hypothetical protein [Helicobacteraceae bacterium]